MAYSRNFRDVVPVVSVARRKVTTTTSATYTYPLQTLLNVDGTRSGEKVDNWKQKVRDGANASSAFTSDRRRLTVRDGSGSWTAIHVLKGRVEQTVVEDVEGCINAPVNMNFLTHSNIPLPTAEAIALKKIYEKIRQEQQHMNSPAVLAEIIDVIRQFGSPFKSLIDLTNRHLNRLALERRRLSGSVNFKKKKWHEIVASTYLEWSFGISPLISDTKSAAEALARWEYENTGEARFRKRVSGRGIDTVSSSTTSTGLPQNLSLLSYLRTDKKVTESRVQYVVGLKGSPLTASGSNERLLQLLGFDHANWIPALWEAVPWGFLVDYVTNVQDILEAGVTNTSQVVWICKTVSNRTEYQVDSRVDYALSSARSQLYGNTQWGGSGYLGGYTGVRTTVTRTIPLSLGIPPLTVGFPNKERQWANMAALLFAKRSESSALWLF